MVIGSTGSGKTTIIRLLLKSIIPRIGKPGEKSKRALVYDNKREYVSLVHAMEPTASLVVFNPFDSRTYAWDISADVTNARHANSIASILIPEEVNSQQPFFADAARAVLSAVMVAFAKMKEKDKQPWTLRDVIVALRSEGRIRTVVRQFPVVEEMVAPYLEDERVLPSILSTIATKIAPFEVVAALWEQARLKGRVMSLSSWLKSESILVLGSSPANRASLDPINRVLFRRLCDLLLDMENRSDALTWVFLDEVREAGKLEGLSSLLNQGRSKGVAVVLGFQEIEGMIQEYGQNIASEIFGQCGHKTFLRTGSAATAGWIEHHWGQTQMMETSYSSSVTQGGDGGRSRTEGVSYQRQVRQAVLASTIMQLPPTGPRSGVLGAFHDIPGRGIIHRMENWNEIAALLKEDDDRKAKASPEKLDECKWPESELDFELVRPWGDSDKKRFRILPERNRRTKKPATLSRPHRLLAVVKAGKSVSSPTGGDNRSRASVSSV